MHSKEQTAIDENLVTGSRNLFFFFGGIAGAIGMPPFEFYRAAQILEYSKIFLRDLNQSWYLRGLPGIGDDAHAVAEYLRRKIAESGASEIYFIGNSMGGFAALLFCAMLRRGVAIAFAPQTFVSPEKRRAHRDDRWPSQINKLHMSGSLSDIYELRPWIQDTYAQMQARVYVSTSDALDVVHANELTDFPHIKIHRFPDAGHNLVKKLRDEGVLHRILNVEIHTQQTVQADGPASGGPAA